MFEVRLLPTRRVDTPAAFGRYDVSTGDTSRAFLNHMLEPQRSLGGASTWGDFYYTVVVHMYNCSTVVHSSTGPLSQESSLLETEADVS